MRSIIGTMALAAVGCGRADGEIGGTAEFEGVLAADVADLAAAVEQVAEPAGTLVEGARASEQACYDAVGECQLCYQLDGFALAGTFDAGLDAAPCSEPLLRDSTYTVDAFDLSGDWSGTLAGDYTIAFTGGRAATLSLEGPRGSGTYAASFDDVDATATTVAYGLDAFDASFTYASFADHAWDVAVSGTATSLTGTVTRDDGITCTLSGAVDDVSVACE